MTTRRSKRKAESKSCKDEIEYVASADDTSSSDNVTGEDTGSEEESAEELVEESLPLKKSKTTKSKQSNAKKTTKSSKTKEDKENGKKSSIFFQRCEDAFNYLDKDKKGYITHADVRYIADQAEFVDLTESDIDEMLIFADDIGDKDGFVKYSDFYKILNKKI